MITGIGHTAYVVQNMEKSLWFYCDVLGFKKAFDIRDKDGNPWIEYIKVRDGQFIELFYSKGNEERAAKPESYSHLCLAVDDIEGIARQVEAKGATLDSRPTQGRDKNWQCWVKDPDGNRIEFMQLDPESPQMKS